MNRHYKLTFVTFTPHTFSDMMANMSLTDAGTQMMEEMVCLGVRDVGPLAILAVCTLFASRACTAVFISSGRPRSSLPPRPTERSAVRAAVDGRRRNRHLVLASRTEKPRLVNKNPDRPVGKTTRSSEPASCLFHIGIQVRRQTGCS